MKPLLATFIAAAAAAWTPGKVMPEALHEMRLQDPTIQVVDVREPDAWLRERVAGAVNVPIGGLRKGVHPPASLRKDRDAYLYCACPDEHASLAAARLLHDRWGYTKLHVLVGGIWDWADTGMPVEKGRPAPKAASPSPSPL